MAAIHIDAFQTNLSGTFLLCQSPLGHRVPPIAEAISDPRILFKHRILITTYHSIIPAFGFQYDTIFHLAATGDWQLALTHIVHVAKPALLVIEECAVPDAVWARLRTLKGGLTCVHIAPISVIGAGLYDSAFFHPVQEPEVVYGALQALHATSYSVKEFRDIMQVLRASGAGVVWTRIREASVAGAVYWYDQVANGDTGITRKQLADMFARLAAVMED